LWLLLFLYHYYNTRDIFSSQPTDTTMFGKLAKPLHHRSTIKMG